MFREYIIPFLHNLPPEIATMLLATLPFGELQASIPIGIEVFGLSVLVTFVVSVIGTMIPVVLILLLLDPVTRFARKYSVLLSRFLDWVYEHVRKKLKGKETLEGIALVLFVSIPLPGAGAWSGSILAVLLGLKFWRAFPCILLGVLIAGLIVTLVTTGVFTGLSFLFG